MAAGFGNDGVLAWLRGCVGQGGGAVDCAAAGGSFAVAADGDCGWDVGW